MASKKLVAITDMQEKSEFKLSSSAKDDLDEFHGFNWLWSVIFQHNRSINITLSLCLLDRWVTKLKLTDADVSSG